MPGEPRLILEPANRPSVANQVFDDLRRRILSLDCPLGMKLSEADFTRQTGVSRKPIRDAFQCLSQLGYLVIRPKSATAVNLISRCAFGEHVTILGTLKAGVPQRRDNPYPASGYGKVDATEATCYPPDITGLKHSRCL